MMKSVYEIETILSQPEAQEDRSYSVGTSSFGCANLVQRDEKCQCSLIDKANGDVATIYDDDANFKKSAKLKLKS